MSASKKRETLLKFDVIFYSGYRGKETPRAVIIGEREFKIEEIIERKRVMDAVSGERYELFKAKMQEEIIEIRRYDSGGWEILFCKKS